ncbi:MAG: reprolysin-like metallopeptidase [Bacteroidota bacterium]
MKQKLCFGLLACMFLISSVGIAQNNDWKKLQTVTDATSVSKLNLSEQKVDFFELDFENFKQQLVNTPLRGATFNSNVNVQLPGIDGRLETFKMYEAPVFAPELAEKFPDIKSYVGYSQENRGAQVRLSVSHKGLQMMISYVDKPTVFMHRAGNNTSQYVVYTRDARLASVHQFSCTTIDEAHRNFTENDDEVVQSEDADDQTLRTFRIAISVTGEYTQYHGGTVADAMAAINASMLRVNAIFEVDMAVTFELIANNDTLIFTNANSDPYSPANIGTGGAWNAELQNYLSGAIGNAAYDIGHLFGATGGGGNAGCIGCVCVDDNTSNPNDTEKGSAYTSPADGIPEGDTFDVDYVAHEIGHQMGANHTWAFSTEGTGVNAEPGSGSTVMAYAGITGANNVQQNSDPYFHYHSIRQVLNNVETRTCWQSNNSPALANNPPSANAGANHVIPQGTAYVLRGSATDPDGGDTLTYCWEQTDSGQVTNTSFGPTVTGGSMNRSQEPTSSPNRYIPQLSRVASGNLTQTNPTINSAWETVATVNRTMNWALTVRDREPTATGLGGQTSYDTMSIQVTTTAGPFTVTSQTSSSVNWEMGTQQTVTWNVANTNLAPVSTSNVNILLSVDGGATFPYTLATNVPNDGSHQVTVPVTPPTSQARIIVEGAGNIFFAMNSTNFTLVEPDFALVFTDTEETACKPANAVYNFTYNAFNGFSGTTTFSTVGLPTGAIATFNPTSASADGTPVTLTISNTAGVASGTYLFSAEGTSGSTTRGAQLTIGVLPGTLSPVTLVSPSNNASNVSTNTAFSWSVNTLSDGYLIEIATDPGFTNIVEATTVANASYTSSGLAQSTTYYWRVGISNDCAAMTYSTTNSFTTQSCSVCASVANTSFETSTTLVNFESINRISAKPSGYSDYTATDIATVIRESSYPITINANTDGPYRTQTIVWIDWNQNCSFNDPGEEYDLGAAINVDNGATANSGMMITVPAGAALGSTTMRVSTRYTPSNNISFPTSCQNGADAEVEDYRVDVQEVLSTTENELEGFAMWPNPTRGDFTVTFTSSSSEDVVIDVFDIRGRSIFSKQYNNSANFTEQVRLGSVQAGMYMVRVNDGERVSVKKLIVR